ncbi:2-oxo-4-hydroxy-4-carboxy-5-ureidoimidazoline decarboxylase [Bermanella marisrubri]|uniref:2-oxo-4-hydroxy-4-carboxy-5-ureidoimidazoline decarboxylase n=1 Tax=Bermanella marisrubri TaxID=207949 RepID=Q1N1R3_9GAMM|nr:2-oxo-4-hydroxy-4-carboxy-5-ureidoimidazoline decarboxylase [Bermanella marisrubri]EAT12218.1 hypothetical protein RED65_04310 [Oceanobacter sp. RED65] [Bermanella marisrubri]QIZ83687.1 2-oxo-4-hydroxy-4-carboxy-5-ureidoimidazoline decarboxylase [Bermanella marisrubri]
MKLLSLDQFNSMTEREARDTLSFCCTSSQWIERVADQRPYDSVSKLQEVALSVWQSCQEQDLLEAFEGHPKIGDVSSLREKYRNTQSLAEHEQSSVAQAQEAVIQELAEKNQAYLDKFGFIFIVFATGKSAQQMLDILNGRIGNERHQELENAAVEQSKITALRIDKLFGLTDS